MITEEVFMSDDTSKRGPRDSSRINMNEDYEVRYWSEKLGITKQELSEAVRRAGSMAKDVEAHLGGASRQQRQMIGPGCQLLLRWSDHRPRNRCGGVIRHRSVSLRSRAVSAGHALPNCRNTWARAFCSALTFSWRRTSSPQ